MADATKPSDLDLLSSKQAAIFDCSPLWKDKWTGMPEYEQKDLMPWQTVKVHFSNRADRDEFSRLVGQPLGDKTLQMWFPQAEIGRIAGKRYETAERVEPRYPIYIISKGRAESRLTVKALEGIGVDYRIVVEPQEFDNYAAVIHPEKILTLPFSNLGQGSIPARNWVWDHAVSLGSERHWLCDDNLDGFYRLNDNLKVRVETGATFCAAEDFADRYTNVALAGFNYFMFAKRKEAIPPFILNTRIYSCILIKNDIPYRWRGRYNEDTDLSLRVLKDGLCTVLFNTFLAMKATTMTMKGGNTDELYKGDGRMEMAKSLQEQHPDVVKITTKWNRPQHSINYKIFRKNKLILKSGAEAVNGVNDYGMQLHDDRAQAT
jgi:hypothetical protein